MQEKIIYNPKCIKAFQDICLNGNTPYSREIVELFEHSGLRPFGEAHLSKHTLASVSLINTLIHHIENTQKPLTYKQHVLYGASELGKNAMFVPFGFYMNYNNSGPVDDITLIIGKNQQPNREIINQFALESWRESTNGPQQITPVVIAGMQQNLISGSLIRKIQPDEGNEKVQYTQFGKLAKRNQNNTEERIMQLLLEQFFPTPEYTVSKYLKH